MSTDWYAPNQQAVGIEPASETAEPKKSSKSKKAAAEEGDDE